MTTIEKSGFCSPYQKNDHTRNGLKAAGGFAIHLATCFTVAAALPAAATYIIGHEVIGAMNAMWLSYGVMTAGYAVCGGYKKPRSLLAFAALGLMAIGVHHAFFMDHAAMGHDHAGHIQEIEVMSYEEAIQNSMCTSSPQPE